MCYTSPCKSSIELTKLILIICWLVWLLLCFSFFINSFTAMGDFGQLCKQHGSGWDGLWRATLSGSTQLIFGFEFCLVDQQQMTNFMPSLGISIFRNLALIELITSIISNVIKYCYLYQLN